MKNLVFSFLIALLIYGCNTDLQTENGMLKLNLDSGWQFKQADTNNWMKARVPGTVHEDLLTNGKIEEPFYRLNEHKQQWIDKKDWEYRKEFKVSDELLQSDHLELCFEGLDTYADVYLNDSLVLQADNMFRSWKAEVKNLIKVGKNELRIYFHSPINKGLKLLEENGYALPAVNDQSENGELGDKKVSPFIRKAPFHFGWDWGPRLVTSGIWRPAYLLGWSETKINDVFVDQKEITEDYAKLDFVTTIQSDKQQTVNIQVTNKATGDTLLIATNRQINPGVNKLELFTGFAKPYLWWPNGLGTPYMYTFQVDVLNNSKVLASTRVKTGLRNIRVVRKPDEKGESFYFEVNGVPVFAKGANYIPNDILLTRVTDEKYLHILKSAAACNMNMLRVWGGGIYENDRFYELCDSLGLMLWHDFMFACSMYPGNDNFLENVRQEAIQNVQRLRNHPSIALWCGNNEIEAAWGQGNDNWGWGWKQRYNPEQRAEIWHAYDTLFYSILPKVVKSDDPEVFYWPSSPAAGFKKLAGYESTSGDVHYWGVWHGKEKFERFNEIIPRFMSEYGFQSFPDFNSVKKYTIPEDWNIESEVMASHQRSGIGNLRIKEYMGWDYHIPEDFAKFLYVGQVLQAEGIEMGIEAHRRNKPYCMGTLYWQLNDCWPVASWSSMDYYGKWKALQYFAKKAYKPYLLSVLNDSTNINVWLVSDELDPDDATVAVTLMDFDGKVLYDNKLDVLTPANTSENIFSIPVKQLLGKANSKGVVLHLSLSDIRKQELAYTDFYFEKPKDLELERAKPIINYIKGKHYQITTQHLLKNLYLYTDDDAVFSDNYFDVLPGKTYDIWIKPGNSGKIVPDEIKTMSLVDTY